LRRSRKEAGHKAPAKTIVDSIIQALKPHIGVPRLSSERIAEICGMKPRALSRLLAGEGTTLTTLINDLKRDFAVEELTHSNRSVVEIAAELGYSDPTSFARSFRKWMGVSPREYRRSKA
jgi:AraC-like DNA-binding protein